MKWYLKCFKQYVDFSGRARRKEYWMFVLFNIIFSICLSIIDASIFGMEGSAYLSTIYGIVAFMPSFAVEVRRLHDIGKSGWNLLFILIPIVGWIMLLIWFCTEGEQCSNDWGEDPKKNDF